MVKTLFFIGAGSFAGGVARYLLSRLVQSHAASGFPWGTLAVNVAGCLVVGVLYALFERGNLMNGDLRLFLTVGFCGGFTTFSTFIHENYALLGEQNFLHFAGYALLSFALGLLAAHLGHLIIKAI
ncbi:MAG TPA: fluoride efflux transporter CrcB [Candidatus Alistipes intestinigallinarum]|uniref:Fluoride-specific ion channel FluC n=1 Tax=Candidatus Alistipes intestinigallinarum TaxID=2838440 RepID=A0A9D1Z2F2_9BACT|nr:fluoride efflux transporter CrcB [Candidatus Alistipes intestinigallinarum]